jgi:hypothetical protein
VVGSMNEMAYVFQAWLPQVVWRQVEAPGYRKGFVWDTDYSDFCDSWVGKEGEVSCRWLGMRSNCANCCRAKKLSGTTEHESEDSLPGVGSEDRGVGKV